jgi:hypothetical protein
MWLVPRAGPEEPSITSVPAFSVSAVGTVLDWSYVTEPSSQACLNNGGRCKWPRGKMVSGTSGTVITNSLINQNIFPYVTVPSS